VLSDRLQELTAAGLISRTVNEGPPLSVTYELTETDRGLIPALNALSKWATESLPATDT
jgi:DNA-binding HxlR family transcriptional regulator